MGAATAHQAGAEVDDRSESAADRQHAAVQAHLARWPALTGCPEAVAWLQLQRDLQRAPRTLEAYGRAVADYLAGIVRLTTGMGRMRR